MEPGKQTNKDFCLVVTPFGATWLCVIDQYDFHNWKHKRHQLRIQDVRGINLIPQQTETGEQVVLVNISNPYPGDTKQIEIYVDQAIVEVIGRVGIDAAGHEECQEHPKLFMNYAAAVKQWRMARSSLAMPTPEEVTAINRLGNDIIPFKR